MRKFTEQELVLATHNAGKAREIADLLGPYVGHFKTAAELDLPEPEETGLTFIANAELKALAAARESGKPALADDSGLAVHALGGDPGIYSARWAVTEDGTRDFALAMQKVEEALAGKDDRSASFICALTLAWPDGHVESVEGRANGQIVWPPRGENGFGYDPIFQADGYDITFGEMDPARKHDISHRADAFAKLVERCLKPE